MSLKNDLTNAIIKARQLRTEESSQEAIEIFKNVIKNKVWLTIPCFLDENEKPYVKTFIVPEHEDFGNFITIFTEDKYFQNVFGTSMVVTDVNKAIEIMKEMGDGCQGIIINPASEAEMVVFKSGILNEFDED